MRRFAGVLAPALLLILATCRADRITQPRLLPILAVSPLRLLDSAAVGSLAARGGTIQLTNIGHGTLHWNAHPARGAAWLHLSATSGTGPTSLPVAFDVGGLAPGTYVDTLVLSAEDAQESPLSVPVEFTIHPCAVTPLAQNALLTDSITVHDCAVPHGGGRIGRVYAFDANAGDSVSLVMTSDSFTPRVVLDGIEGNPLRYVQIATAGTYLVEATTLAPEQMGSFTLSISRPRAPHGGTVDQFGADSSSAVGVGGSVDFAGAVFAGTLQDPDGDSLHLEVELRPGTEAFTSAATVSSSRVGNGARAVAIVYGLANNTSYHWQWRVVDQTGRASPWTAFGANDDAAPDFRVSPDVARELSVLTSTQQSGVVASDVPDPPGVVVRDQFGNPVPGVAVAFDVTSGDGRVEPAVVVTDLSGVAAATRWTAGTVAGLQTVSATAAGAGITGNPAVFNATAIAAAPFGLRILQGPSSSARSGIVLPQQPIVQLIDRFGNAAVGAVAITVSVETGAPELSGALIVVTDASGAASFSDLAIRGSTGARTIRFEATGLSSVTSAPIDVTSGLPHQVAIHNGNNQTATAGELVAVPPSVIVTDASGNPVPGVAVTFEVLPDQGTITGAAQATDSNGVATLGGWRLATTAQPCSVTVALADIPGALLTFVDTATTGAAAILTIVSGDNQNGEVGSVLSDLHRVRVTDAHGNPVSRVLVEWLAEPGGSVEPASGTTDAAGEATTQRTLGTTPGTHTTSATVSLAGTPAAAVFHLGASAGAPAQLMAAGGDGQTGEVGATLPSPVAVQVLDRFGNPVPGVLVTWSVSAGAGSIAPASAITDASGNTSATWTLGIVAAPQSLQSHAGDLPPLTFNASARHGPVRAARSSVTASPLGITASTEGAASTLTVVARDAYDNVIGGVPVVLTISGTANSWIPTADTTDANGTYSAAFRSSKAEVKQISVTIGDVALSEQVMLTVLPAAAASVALHQGNGQVATVNSAVLTAPSVVVRDEYGNAVPDVEVTFVVSEGGGAVQPGDVVRTDAGGFATLASWTLGTVAGPNSLTASATGVPTTVSFAATATPDVAASVVAAAGNGQSATVSTVVGTPPTVITRDRFANPIPGVAVTFAVASGGGSIAPATPVTTNENGVASASSWTLGTAAGSNTLTATADGVGAAVTFSALGTPDVAASLTVAGGDAQTAIVNSAVAVPPSVGIVDRFGNPIAGVAVSFEVVTGAGTVSPAAIVSDANGVATATSWTLGTIAGANTVRASAAALPGHDITFSATGTPAAAATIELSNGDSQVATVNTPVATAPSVLVRDQFANPVPGVTVGFAVASGGGSVAPAEPVTTNAQGVAVLDSWTLGTIAGLNSLTATVSGLLSPVTFSATGTAGVAAAIHMHTGNDQTATVFSAVSVAPAVLVQDHFGNPVANALVMLAIASGGGSVTPETVTTDSAGIAAATAWTLGTSAGENRLRATATALPADTITFVATGTAAAAATIAGSAGDGQTATVNNDVATLPAVVVRDQFGNPTAGVPVTFTASAGGTVAQAEQSTNALGVASVGSWTLGTVARSYTLEAASGELSGTPVVFTALAVPAAPDPNQSSLDVSPTAITASAGSSVATISVRVRDQYGNNVGGAGVVITVSGTGNTLTQSAIQTDPTGQMTATLSATRAETKSITATVNDTVHITDGATATVTHAAAAVIAALTGDGQGGYVEHPVATTPAALVTDEFGNVVPDIAVTFAVASGDGSVAPTIPIMTNAAGVAAATSWTLGSTLGAHSVSASAAGLAASFSATATLPPVPDPSVLPVATGQAPDTDAYAALDVPNQPAGFSYTDPVTGVRVWKVTDATMPAASMGAGHDYADGGNQVSRGWGPDQNSHTIVILTWQQPGVFSYYLVDFTRGVGLSNYRPLTVQPRGDLAVTFSNRLGEPRILYILTHTQLVRYNTETMQEENTGNFPLNISSNTWLHQDKNDVWFVGFTTESRTAFAWNSQTNELRTQSESWLDEPRLDRDGRYVVLGAAEIVRTWDLETNTLGPTQIMDPETVGPTDAFWFGHIASLRSRWVTANPNATTPAATDRYFIAGDHLAKQQVLTNSFGNLVHYAGNWLQYNAELGGDLDRQWAYGSGQGLDDPRFAWRHAVGLVRADGSDARLLLHHYSTDDPTYYATPWGMPSPDGKVVIFNSDMQVPGASRWDLFVAEVPIKNP